MKFQPDTQEGVNMISRLDPGPPPRVWVGAAPFERGVLVPWTGPVLSWLEGGFDGLSPAHFERVAALEPEVVIFGSGTRLRFPPPFLLRALIERRIGVETMDTAAACRTYNVLAGERRRVLGALLIDPS
jgi:uncharacterized protein